MNPYSDLYKAKNLRDRGKYRAAIAKYEQAEEKLPRFSVDTQVIHVSFPAFLKYYIAFCYTQLAEAEGDVSLYIKAEAAAKESYEMAIIPSDQSDALYLWGYILFKQARYEEARAKFEAALIGIPPQNQLGADFTADTLFVLGKALIELGDEPAARQVFGRLEARIEAFLPSYNRAEAFYGLGKAYLQLGDTTAAQRVFGKLEVQIEADLQEFGYHFRGIDFYEQTLYGLGKVYLQLGDEPTAHRVFGRLLKHYPDSAHKDEVKHLLEK